MEKENNRKVEKEKAPGFDERKSYKPYSKYSNPAKDFRSKSEMLCLS